MPALDVEAHSVYALCAHFAHKPEFDLNSSSLARAVQSVLPGTTVVHGSSRVLGGEPEPCSWLRTAKREYDVQLMARRRRANVGHALKCDPTRPCDRILTEEEGSREEGVEEEEGDVRDYTQELVDWVCPTCAACCGKNRAHTINVGCVSPWKAEKIKIRANRERASHMVFLPL